MNARGWPISHVRLSKLFGAVLISATLLSSSQVALAQFTQQTKLVGTGAVGTTGQGWSVALSADGSTATIGGPEDNGGKGAAWGQPASAQVPLPPDLISQVTYAQLTADLFRVQVPHDVPTGSAASIQDLAIFAWREFIALNWPAMDPATTNLRGRANVNSDFLTITADSTGTYPLLDADICVCKHIAQTDLARLVEIVEEGVRCVAGRRGLRVIFVGWCA